MILGTKRTEKLTILSEPNEEVDLDFAGPLDKNWGNSKYFLLCIDRFSKFPSAKLVNKNSASSIYPGQFGMKSLAENICWSHLFREIYYQGTNCIQCIKAGKNLKVILGTNRTEKLTILSEPNEEVDLDFSGPLDKNWGNSKYLFLCIDRFSNFPSAKLVNNNSASSILSFLSDYCHLQAFPKSIRVDHGSCFISNDFRNFCEKTTLT